MTTEAERQFYLAQMGVHLWYARAPLPGAAPTPPLDFTEPDTPEFAPSPAGPTKASEGPSSGRVGSSQGNVRELLKSIGGDKTGREKAEPRLQEESDRQSDAPPAEVAAPEATQPTGAATSYGQPLPGLERAHLDLGLWSGARLCLVSGMSTDVSPDLQNQLAANILKALGEIVAKRRQFVWPVFNNPRVMKNAARDLSTLIKGLSEELLGDRRLVVLGQIADTEHAHDELVAQLSSDPIVCADSLAALAADPAKKRELWHRLQEQILGVG